MIASNRGILPLSVKDRVHYTTPALPTMDNVNNDQADFL